MGCFVLDLVIGANHRQALVTLNERKSRYILIGKVERKTADSVSDLIISLPTPFSEFLHTLTTDNGKEFAQHDRIAESLKSDHFFAHPYCSWERGANENMNGLIRQFFPKKMRFEDISEPNIIWAMNNLNHRPRKMSGLQNASPSIYETATIASTCGCTSKLNPPIIYR